MNKKTELIAVRDELQKNLRKLQKCNGANFADDDSLSCAIAYLREAVGYVAEAADAVAE